jgi:hypothetical protein
MKTLYFLSAMLLLSTALNAQSKLTDFRVSGGFGNPVAGFNFKNGTTLNMGGEGAVVFANNIFVGRFGMGTTSANNNMNKTSTLSSISTLEHPNYHIESEYGGFWIGYIIRLNKRFYVNVSGKVGSGQVLLNNHDIQTTVYDKVSVIKPQLSVDVKLLSILAITVGGGYTHFGNMSIKGYGAGNFNSSEFFAGIKMGWW